MRPATRHMRETRRGRIITFTSTAGLEGSAGQPNYSAAKEGIVGLTRSTALAMARYGVTVNCISPSAETRMTERLPDDRRAQAAAPPEAVAPVVTFLASDRAAHITGQVIHVRSTQVTLWSHPAPLRAITSREGLDARDAGPGLGRGARSGPAAATGYARDSLAAEDDLAVRLQNSRGPPRPRRTPPQPTRSAPSLHRGRTAQRSLYNSGRDGSRLSHRGHRLRGE